MNTPKQASWIVKKIFDVREWFRQNNPNESLSNFCKNGKFCIKKLYNASRPQFQKCNWKRLTIASKAIPRHKFILWLALHRRLATVERLQRWGLMVSKDCVLYRSNEEEALDHLLFDCAYSRTMWATMLRWTGMQHQIGSWDEEIEWMAKVAVSKSKGEILVFLFTAVIYHVWQERNNRRFQGKEIECSRRIKEVVQMLHIRGQKIEKWKRELEKLNSHPS
uniref:Reverse transcriptase zinc-binding domain-containing protein n=1 Tax=Nicotiana tabacum TaxID=4097 RepID=A0A1S4BGY3_TOBAC|nr:PREDICTED: uncharacterized protein LOC107808126 [Nicotiana tabacum]